MPGFEHYLRQVAQGRRLDLADATQRRQAVRETVDRFPTAAGYPTHPAVTIRTQARARQRHLARTGDELGVPPAYPHRHRTVRTRDHQARRRHLGRSGQQFVGDQLAAGPRRRK